MAQRWLVLDFSSHDVCITVARARGTAVSLESSFTLRWQEPQEDPLATATARGAQLADALNEQRLSRLPVYLLLPRTLVELKPLTLPPSPDTELPDLVRFAAGREFQTLGENGLLDYVPLDAESTGPRHVLAAVLATEMRQRATAWLAAANIKPTRISIRPFATASLVQRQSPSAVDHSFLVVDILPDEVELTAVCHGKVIFARSARLATEDLDKPDAAVGPLLGELRRTLATVPQQSHAQPIDQLYVCGSGPAMQRLNARLQEQLEVPVKLLDPLATPGLEVDAGAVKLAHPGRLSAGLGLLADEAEGIRPAIDLAQPRRKPLPPSRRRPLTLAAVAVALLVGVVGWQIWSDLATLDREIADKNQQLRDRAALVKKAGELEKTIGKISPWIDSEVAWLDELGRLMKTLPPAQELMLSQIILSPHRAGGEIQLDGVVKDSRVMGDMVTKLRDPRHQVSVSRGQDVLDAKQYGWQFQAQVLVLPPPAEAEPAASAKPAVNPAVKTIAKQPGTSSTATAPMPPVPSPAKTPTPATVPASVKTTAPDRSPTPTAATEGKGT